MPHDDNADARRVLDSAAAGRFADAAAELRSLTISDDDLLAAVRIRWPRLPAPDADLWVWPRQATSDGEAENDVIAAAWMVPELRGLVSETRLEEAGDTNPVASVEVAHLLIGRGDHDAARARLERDIAAGSRSAPIVLGNLLSDVLGDNHGAEAAYRLGIERGDAFSAYNLAALLDGQGRALESAEWLRYAAEHGDTRAAERLRR